MPEIQDTTTKAEVTTAETIPTTESSDIPQEEIKKQPDRHASRFAALAKREKAIVAEEARIKALAEEVHGKASKYQTWEQVLSKAKENPVEVLKAANISYDELTRFILNDNKPDPDRKLEELNKRIEEVNETIKKKDEELERKELEANKKYVDQVIESYRGEVDAHISGNPEEYELIVANNSQHEVFSLIELWFEKTGEVLSPEKAAKMVEEQLLEETKKILGLKKLQPLIKPEEPQKPAPTFAREKPKTLTNNMTAESSGKDNNKALTREERLEKAKKQLVFNKN